MTKHSRLLILVLACWLPMQSFAVALLHCHALDAAVAAAAGIDTHHAKAAASAKTATADCHGDAASRSETADAPADAAETSTTQSAGFCIHCAANCEGMQTLSLDPLEQDFGYAHDSVLLRLSTAVIDQLPENPQRPPKYTSLTSEVISSLI